MDRDAIARILGPRFEIVSGDGALALRELALPAGASVLDVGTGAGNFAIFLALQGYRVLTGEPASDASRYARQDWATNAEKVGVRDHIRFEPFDAGRMPFAPGSFDAVFFFGVLHHIDEAVRTDVVREALRVARADGAVVFFEPRRQMLERLWVDDPGHPHAANPPAYLSDRTVRQRRLEGAFMDIFIFDRKKPATGPHAAAERRE
jgi:SAM-dependent methyltransferase